MITLNNKKPLILAVVAVVAFALFMSPTFAASDVMAKIRKELLLILQTTFSNKAEILKKLIKMW